MRTTGLVARRVPEKGWAAFDKKTGEKVWPPQTEGWARSRQRVRDFIWAREAGWLEEKARS